MANARWTDGIKESTVEEANKVDIEETCVTSNCVKNEPNEERLDFEEDDYPTQYRISLKYENLFGESTHYRIINEDYDNLIGFEDNDVVMENAMIKLEAINEEYDWSFNNIDCSKCKGIYNGYCLKCSSLLHILNKNSTFENSESESSTIPKNILEIRETSKGKGVYLLTTLPKSIIFGPFEGILGIENTIGHSWKVIDNKLINIESGNWMTNILCAPNASLKNLDIYQFDGNLYFQASREIKEGEELLIYYDDKELRQMDNGEKYLYTPQKLEKLPKVFACTWCCFGFGSNKCLIEHKKKCCLMEYNKSIKDFVLVECHSCKMWLEKWEHEKYHVAYCLEKLHRIRHDYSEADMDVEEMEDNCDANDEETQCFSGANHDIGLTERPNNEEVHNATETHKKDHFKNHLKKQRGIKKFQCDLCMVKFTDRMNLKAHLRNKHADDGSAKDYKSTESTNDKQGLQNHKIIKPLTCHICMKKFVRKSYLKVHIRNIHTDNGSAKDYKCSECPYQTNYKNNLQKHLNIHRGIKPFECDICRKKFGQKNNLKLHIRSKHTEDESAEEYRCSECPYQTNHKQSLQKHLNRHKMGKFECGICMKRFVAKYSLKKHIKNKHVVNEGAKDSKCQYKGDKKFQCDICLAKFSSKSSLDRHKRDIHTKNESAKNYKCSECSYQTNHKSVFQKHINTHRGIKPFECDICMRKFTQKANLKLHVKNIHTEDESAKDYKCSQCSYKTNVKTNLQRHLNNHTGIKPFQCDICKMKFTEKGSLGTHIKKHHTDNGSEKDYKCSECSYQTNYKRGLQRHLNMHKDIKPFQCGICMAKFTRKTILATHINNKHTSQKS